MNVVLPQPLINSAFAPPSNDSNYRSQLLSNLGVAGPVQRGADGSRELTREEQQIMLFGPPQRDVRQDPYASLGIENKILPDAWVGKNNYIRQVLLNLIRGDKAVWVEEILPWRDWHGGSEVTLQRIKFHDHLLDDIPEQGVPRLVIQSQDRFTTTIDRKGLAFHMESGFAMTPQGLEDYAMNMLQIQQATVSTACLSVLINLLNAPVMPVNYFQAYHLPVPNPTIKRIFEHEINTCGMLTVAEDGFLKMQSLGIQALAAHNVTPDTLILPHNTGRIYNYAHPESTDYSRAGPRGPVRLESDAGVLQSQAKMRVIESRPFLFGERDLTMDPTVRERGFGQHFQMSFRFMPMLDAGEIYPVDCLDIMVQDCDNDAVRVVSYWDALKNCGAVRRDGNGNQPPVTVLNNELTLLDYVMARPTWLARARRRFEKVQFNGLNVEDGDALQGLYNLVNNALQPARPDERPRVANLADFNNIVVVDPAWTRAAENVLLRRFVRLLQTRIRNAYDAGRNALDAFNTWYSVLTIFYSGSQVLWHRNIAIKLAIDLFNIDVGPRQYAADGREATNNLYDDVFGICSGYGVPSPFEILLLRPHMVWQMGSAIMMKRGSATGSTLIGHGDFELGRDVNRKMLLGYYTVYLGCVIERPQNVHVLHNVLPVDFMHGGGITIYDAHDDVVCAAYSTGSLQEAQRRDMFACLVKSGIEHPHIDITGQFPQEIQPDRTLYHYDSHAQYTRRWGWTTPAVYMDSMTKFFDERVLNVRCAQGTQFIWGRDSAGRPNPKAQIKTGSCHFGPCIYTGWVADVLGRGRNRSVLKLHEVTNGAVEAVFR